VHRLWKRAHLQVKRPKTRRQRRESPARLAAVYPCQIWTYVSVDNRDVHDNVLRILTVMNEFTHKGLAINVGTATLAERLIGVLTQ
jgi:hypothetical protein